MAARTSRTSNQRRGGATRASTARASSSRTSKARAASSRRGRTGRGGRGRTRRGAGHPLQLFTAVWMALAHAIGWAVRAVGRQAASAKQLDAEHRRDGAGLLLLALAILLAVAVWLDGGGPVGEGVARATRGAVGVVAMFLPPLLLLGTLRLMRAPAGPEVRGRATVGWSALLVAVTGLLDLAQQPADLAGRETAGGLLGGLGGLLGQAVTAWVATPMLILLAVFGLLVVTATPINKIPDRLAWLRDFLLGRPLGAEVAAMAGGDDSEEEDGPATPARRSPARRRQQTMAKDLTPPPEPPAQASPPEIEQDPAEPPAAGAAKGKGKGKGGTQPPAHSEPLSRAQQPALAGIGAATTRCRRRTCCDPAAGARAAARPTSR